MGAQVACLALVVSSCASQVATAPPGFDAATTETGAHRFVEVAPDVGLDFRHGAFNWEAGADPVASMGGGVCWIDFDRDGWMDLYLVNSYAESEWGEWQDAGGLPRNALYRNDEGMFTDVSASSGADLEMRGNGCVAADLDGDGWTDLYVTSARFNALLWNEGDGTFTEGAEAAGVDAYQWQSGAAAGDFNGDGLIDLAVTGYVDLNNRLDSATQGFPNTQVPLPDLLFLNQGNGDGNRPTFREVSAAVGLNSEGNEYGLQVVASDIDGDGDLDLYVSNDTDPNRLYLNEPSDASEGFRFVERSDAGADDDNASMGVASGDADGDGRPDLFITSHFGQEHVGYRNLSDAAAPKFAPLITASPFGGFDMDYTGWGTNWLDGDLDGDLDLVIAYGHVPVLDLDADREPLQFLENAGRDPLRLEDVSDELGFADIPERIWRGSAAADYDNDGDVDLAVLPIGERIVLLENVAPHGEWVAVVADPPEPGTVIEVEAGPRSIRRELLAGSSWLSSEDPRFIVGLGDITGAVPVTVTWLDGSVSSALVDVNSVVRLEKGAP